MFLKFKTTEERRVYSGSDFIEIQYCTLPSDTPNNDVVAVDAIKHWNLSSLYISGDDWNMFYAEYWDVLGEGLYNNLCEGIVDGCGINYYNGEKTEKIIGRLKIRKPKEYEILLEWLMDNLNTNGFYVLGL